MKSFRIAASLLSANFLNLGDEVDAVATAGVDLLHLDVMDNHYVPNLTFGPLIGEALARKGRLPLDVHLMVEPVDALITAFAMAGAHQISFHPEASAHVDRSLQLIKDLGCKAGLALNPATSLSVLNYVWDKLDFILLMSVNPGFAGQSFLPTSLSKIRTLRDLISSQQYATRIAIDGGIKVDNIRMVADAGADTFVLGSAIFNTKNYFATVQELRNELATVP